MTRIILGIGICGKLKTPELLPYHVIYVSHIHAIVKFHLG